MKNKLSTLALSYFTFRASFIGITTNILINEFKQNSWITFLVSGSFSFVYVLLIYFLALKIKKRKILSEIKNTYPRIGTYITYLIEIPIFLLTILNFFNLIDLISIQFLYKTPKIIISIILIIPIYYLSRSSNNSFKITVLLLFYLNIILYVFSFIGLFSKINITNILPINFEIKTSLLSPIVFNTIPLFMLLSLPNIDINKNFIYGFILAFLSELITLFVMISILGIDLIRLFKYPEFLILKLAFDGIINVRLQNILGIQFILDMIVFTSIGLKYTYETIKINKKIVFPIMLISIVYYLNINYLKIYNIFINFLQYILLITIPFISIILLIKKRELNSLKNN